MQAENRMGQSLTNMVEHFRNEVPVYSVYNKLQFMDYVW